MCCDFDLPGASQRRGARRKEFYFENQADFLAFHKTNFLSVSSAPKQKLTSNGEKIKRIQSSIYFTGPQQIIQRKNITEDETRSDIADRWTAASPWLRNYSLPN